MEHLILHQQVGGFVAMQSDEVSLKLVVKGFSQSERQMLDAILKLSQRRQPRLSLLGVNEEEGADVVMIDAADPSAMKWASRQSWLKRTVVIWVDASNALGANVVTRPIQWPILPMMLARALERGPVKAVEGEDGASKCSSVLVVDDSIAVRTQLRSLLERRGLDVTEADSAEAALKAAAASSYCCILMDVLMPGIDGYEACRLIKARSRTQAVVMLTSRTSPFDRIRGKMAGCDAYLTKPVDPDQLHKTVSRYLAKPAESEQVMQLGSV